MRTAGWRQSGSFFLLVVLILCGAAFAAERKSNSWATRRIGGVGDEAMYPSVKLGVTSSSAFARRFKGTSQKDGEMKVTSPGAKISGMTQEMLQITIPGDSKASHRYSKYSDEDDEDSCGAEKGSESIKEEADVDSDGEEVVVKYHSPSGQSRLGESYVLGSKGRLGADGLPKRRMAVGWLDGEVPSEKESHEAMAALSIKESDKETLRIPGMPYSASYEEDENGESVCVEYNGQKLPSPLRAGGLSPVPSPSRKEIQRRRAEEEAMRKGGLLVEVGKKKTLPAAGGSKRGGGSRLKRR